MTKMLIEEEERRNSLKKHEEDVQQLQHQSSSTTKQRTVSFSNASLSSNNSSNSSPKTHIHHLTAKPSYDLLKVKNRNSYCGPHEVALQEKLLRSYSGDITKEPTNNKSLNNEMEQSKVSITPSSPMQSPRYSLLMGGDTSSENSSAVTTPQHDLEPLMLNSAMSGISVASSNQMQQLLMGVETSSYLGTSHESLGSNMNEKRDMQALKRELSLDLNTVGGGPKLLSDANLNRNLNLISPNSNFTDNTSQSVTPSEFGYHNLQRQLSMHSLIVTEENSPAYEEYENTPSNLNSPLKNLASPIKSTISITYNLKSPTKEDLPEKTKKPSFMRTKEDRKEKIKNSLLETSFDENTVYEQVKFFRNSVTEVNQLLNEERLFLSTELENLAEIEADGNS